MKPSLMLAIALFSGSIPLVAQQQGPSGISGGQVSHGVVSTVTVNGPAPQSQAATAENRAILAEAANCPVALNVSHLADGSIIRTGNGTGSAHPKGIGQWLHITVMTPTVSTAQLLVRGFTDKPRVTQSAGKNGPDAERTVTISFGDRPNGEAIGDVWAPGLTSVDSINLISLTYRDGTQWSAPSGHVCSVTPDKMMLISGR